MGIDPILVQALKAPATQVLRDSPEEGGVLTLEGVSDAAWPFLVTLLHHLNPGRSILAVVDSLKSQELIHQDLQTWLPSISDPAGSTKPRRSQPLFFPAWDVLPNDARLPHADVVSERLETLLALVEPGSESETPAPQVIVTSATALQQRTYGKAELRSRTRRLTRGDRCDPLDLVEWLEDQAYEPEVQVTQKGELSLRGGILDVFPLSSPWPVRLEFVGDQLESLRFFDPITQISREPTEWVVLPPAGELGILRQLREAQPDQIGSLVEFLPVRTFVLLFDLPSLVSHTRHYAGGAQQTPSLFVDWESVITSLLSRRASIIQVSDLPPASLHRDGIPDSTTEPGTRLERKTGKSSALRLPSLEAFRPMGGAGTTALPVLERQRRTFFEQLHRWLRQDYAVHVLCNNDGERQRFEEIWSEYGLSAVSPPSTDLTPTKPTAPGLTVHLGTLSRGFLFDDARLVVVTDAEIFGRYRVPRPRRLKSPHAHAMRSAFEIDFTELEEGDYVVHLQHGIGRYLGLRSLPLGTRRNDVRPEGESAVAGQECLLIEYAGADSDQAPPRLYVPVTQSHLVSKYVGAGKARPSLNTLGGARWAKAKAHAEQAVHDLASELLAIQAARESQAGHPHPPDTPWQREFESAFLYEETPDQHRAIQETKLDLERPRPMDRLICGDVGFGKTEVAIRAAFKTVMGGKQVAVLVPTTVLAQQHFNTFRDRMADYPIRIELLSRFRTRRNQDLVIRDLAAGAVDIVIGTHRLVQSDVRFKDLGLVVVDEEQRFGVLQKEQFKRLRQLVDVLTLSATPIPRTLYLALTGARDMSTIESPPQDRLPIETIVTPYDERVIRDAILRELSRSGQIFFLHNRVTSIHTIGRRLQELVPDLRLVIGHGQMPAEELEEVMTRFVNGEADLLLATTIIESGIDIPNANTIIIDRADRFGLSDLYQLRGRVGRYKHQAYAYFLVPRHAALLADARKRISAIRQYSSLGSGFKIAMRDLEIRGAGNLLGSEQSGHITAVGFELYCQLLQQSVATLKGDKPRARINVSIRLDFIDLNPGDAGRDEGGGRKAGAGSQETDEQTTAPTSPSPISHLRAPNSELRAASSDLRVPAFLPRAYVPEPKHRIEIYRRLAQATDTKAIKTLELELRDRFGPLPDAAKLLLQVADLRILAANVSVTAIETRGDRLMLTRGGELVTSAGKFPRLTHAKPHRRLNEIRKVLLSL